MTSALVSGLAFFAGFVLPAVGIVVFYGAGQATTRPGAGDLGSVLTLAVVQALLGAIVFALVTALGRGWRLRSRRAKLVVGILAGALAYLLSWTGLLAVGLLARTFGDGVLQRAGGDVAGWILAAWPGLLAGLVVLAGAAIVAPPSTRR